MAKKNVAAAPAPPSVTYTNAMDKIRDEMAKSRDNYVQVVGEYLTGYLLEHPEAEAALMEKGKSIKGSLETVRKEAEKVKTGNVAILDDRTVFGIVLGYFGIKGTGNREQGTGIAGKAPAAAGTSSDPASGATFPKGEGLNGDGGPGAAATGDADFVAAMASQHVGEIAAAMGRHAERLRNGEITDRHPDYDDAPADPFDLDALLGVM